jgi:hypothetical protein
LAVEAIGTNGDFIVEGAEAALVATGRMTTFAVFREAAMLLVGGGMEALVPFVRAFITGGAAGIAAARPVGSV